MDDFRFLQNNCLWIVIIAIFLLLFFGGNCGNCNNFNLDGMGNLFGGCGNNSCLWIIIVIIVICFLMNGECGGFLRGDIQ